MSSLPVVSQFGVAGSEASTSSRSHWRSALNLQALESTPGGMVRMQNYINGEFVDAMSGAILEDIEPARGITYATIPRSGADDVESAVAAARAAFPAWSKTSTLYRATFLDKIADAIEAWGAELAAMESKDSGKTLKMAQNVDIPRSVANFRFFAGQLRHDETGCFPMHDALNYTIRAAIGVAGLISPWNLPLYLLSWKVAPALACGNTVIAKPSEITPRTASALAQIIHAIGLPPGVFNLVHGLGGEAGQALVAHSDVPLISFTGGTSTGKVVASTCAPLFKKVSLELGGKNATVVFADSDLTTVVAGAVRSAFTNNGQVCLSGSRVFVERSIYDAFEAKFISAVKALKCGDPSDPHIDVGPVSSGVHKDKILSYVRLAVEEGGTIACGGEVPAGLPEVNKGGYFVQPCVITGLRPSSRVATEEIFGPVCTLHAFDSEDEVVMAVNSSRYGLAGSIWTQNLTRAHRVARNVHSGLLWINCWLHRCVSLIYVAPHLLAGT
jgi:aminomuconate-semialdehyde/2-hydroxymuconate-6-semialdehyde dehydrogenase